MLFGESSRVTVAHLVEPTAALHAATSALRERVPDLRHPVWTPHVTLARRVPRAKVPAVLAVLAATPEPRTLVADRLRWWDPESRAIVEVASSRPQNV